MSKLYFGPANDKLVKLEILAQAKVVTFTLPAGRTCPGARDCLSWADRHTGKITDGPDCAFRCFSASGECIYPTVRKIVWSNFETLAPCGNDYSAMAKLISESLPAFFNICRLHVGGDFYSQAYFDAWLEVAKANPARIFYAYTKSLPFWIKRMAEIPANFRLTASRGGKHDELIGLHNLKCAEVVFSEAEAANKGLEIDSDDSHAALGTKSFALLIHNTQPAGSPAAKAWSAVKKAKQLSKVS